MVNCLWTCLIMFELVTSVVMQNISKTRFVRESDENYPKHVLHLYGENKPAMKRNEVVLNDLPSKRYIIEANDKIPGNCKQPLALIQAAQNQNQTNIGGLAKLLKLKIKSNYNS